MNMLLERRLISTLVIVLAYALGLWASPVVAQDDAGEGEIITASADISSVTVQISAQANTPPIIEITGEVFDSCTEVGSITQMVTGDLITLDVQTERPAELFCAQVLETFETAVTLDTTALSAGDYRLSVNGVLTDVTITEAMLNTPTEGLASPTPQTNTCPQADDTAQLVRDEASGVCFLVPVSFTVETFQDFNTEIIANGALFDSGQGVSLRVSIMDEAARDIADIASEAEANAADVVLNFTEAQIGNARALVTDNAPGPVGTRLAYVQQDDTVLSVTLTPIDTLFPDASAEAEITWALFVESLTFINDESAITTPPDAVTGCPLPAIGQQAYEDDDLCFLYPQGYNLLGGAGNITIVVQNFNDAQQQSASLSILIRETDAQTLDDLLAARQAAFPDVDLTFEPVFIGQEEGAQTTDIPARRGNLQAYVLRDGIRYQFTVNPVDEALPQDSQNALTLWAMVQQSLIFKGA